MIVFFFVWSIEKSKLVSDARCQDYLRGGALTGTHTEEHRSLFLDLCGGHLEWSWSEHQAYTFIIKLVKSKL